MSSIIKTVKTKDGFINYYGVDKLYDSVQKLFKKADELSSQGKNMEFFNILSAVFECLAKEYLHTNSSCEEYGDMLNALKSRFKSLANTIEDDLMRSKDAKSCVSNTYH